MQTLFGMYREYDRAQSAVAGLIEAGIEERQINAIALDDVREERGLTLQAVQAASADRSADAAMPPLDQMLGRQQPVVLPDLGPIVAAGDVATIVARSAAAPGAIEQGLAGALAELGLPAAHAADLVAGIKEGSILIWAQVPDEMASALAQRMRGKEDADGVVVHAV